MAMDEITNKENIEVMTVDEAELPSIISSQLDLIAELEEKMNAAIEKNKALKHKFKKNSAGEIGFEKDPKQVAAEMKQKAAETVQKLSDDDMLNAKSSDLDIQGRQLQQQTRSASLLERLVSFFTGDKPAFGVGKIKKKKKR